MSRSTSIIGLPESADEFLNENVKRTPEVKCQHCGHTKGGAWVRKDHKDCSDEGMFNDGPMLMKYQLKDDSWVYEELQDTIWSSGPCIFTKLVNDKGEDLFVWTKREIEEYI